MKAQIRITGQISSIHHIENSLGGCRTDRKKGMFNTVIIVFASIAEAKEAIKIAGQKIREEKPRDPMYDLAKDYKSISYDAATAKIEKYN